MFYSFWDKENPRKWSNHMKTHALHKNGKVRVLQVCSSENLNVSFTKALPLLLSRSSYILSDYIVSKTSTYVHMRRSHCVLHFFFLWLWFFPLDFLVMFFTRKHLIHIIDIKGKCYKYCAVDYINSCSPMFTCTWYPSKTLYLILYMEFIIHDIRHQFIFLSSLLIRLIKIMIKIFH